MRFRAQRAVATIPAKPESSIMVNGISFFICHTVRTTSITRRKISRDEREHMIT